MQNELRKRCQVEVSLEQLQEAGKTVPLKAWEELCRCCHGSKLTNLVLSTCSVPGAGAGKTTDPRAERPRP